MQLSSVDSICVVLAADTSV